MKFLPLLLAILIMTATSGRAQELAQKPLRVLFVGNSQCPVMISNRLIENLAASDKGARPMAIVGCVKGGGSLKSHWDLGMGPSPERPSPERPSTARAMIAGGGWDFVVLQDIYSVEAAAFQPYARQFHALVRESGAKTVLFGTASILSDYPKGFERQHRLHLDLGKKLGVPIVDASYAYFRYFGERPSPERLESLFAQDKAHPGLRGSYLYACMIYSVLTGRSAVRLAAPADIPSDVAKTLQETAWAQHQETMAAVK